MAAVRRNRMTRVLAATAIVTGCAAPATTGPTGTEAGPAIFYSKNGVLYVSDPVGAPGRKLTNGPGDGEPSASPDGSRIAYVRKADPAGAGGELWVLDVSSGDARRLVDPAALVPKFEGDRPEAGSPHWSPAGDRIAFLKTGAGGGGFLLTADAGTGAVQAPATPLYADDNYSWAPDGKRIAWVGGRSDVSPVDVNVLTVGGGSEVVAKGTNATSVGYAPDGRSVLFSNLDANGSLFTAIPFGLRAGGIFSVDVANPSAAPKPLLSGTGAYADVAPLASGDIGYTEWIQERKTKDVMLLGGDRSTRKVAEGRTDAARPAWRDDTVAYIGTADDRPLIVTRPDGTTTTVAAGVEDFAWGR